MATMLIVFLLFGVPMLVMEVLYRRSLRRSDLWYARFQHRKHLASACAAGETSLEWHAMRCTRCGNFHPEDDDECPELS